MLMGSQFVIAVDSHCQVSASEVERILSVHFLADEFETFDIEFGMLPRYSSHDIGAFLRNRHAYAELLLENYPYAEFCIVLATVYLYLRLVDRKIPHDFLLLADRGNKIHPYRLTNQNHAQNLKMRSCPESVEETLCFLWETVNDRVSNFGLP